MAIALTETPAARCARYAKENHFIGVEVNQHDQIVLRAGHVDAIQMPRPLGDRVRTELLRLHEPTPTIENIDTGFLTFLTQRAPTGDSRAVHILPTLFKYQAIRTVHGSLITLPGPSDTRRIWMEEPIDENRPNFDTLATIVLEAARALPTAC
ncbi:hypothetical protein [Nocardia sp. CNY236]|uniref:hypothetical protein n=1 Tax=Nocardia sp. CNY236 TaxID=1169152 RepID=UPI000404B31F|nr:hypothetical protein [Nocardia sp. CNY236]